MLVDNKECCVVSGAAGSGAGGGTAAAAAAGSRRSRARTFHHRSVLLLQTGFLIFRIDSLTPECIILVKLTDIVSGFQTVDLLPPAGLPPAPAPSSPRTHRARAAPGPRCTRTRTLRCTRTRTSRARWNQPRMIPQISRSWSTSRKRSSSVASSSVSSSVRDVLRSAVCRTHAAR